MSYLYTKPDGTITAFCVGRMQDRLDAGDTEHVVDEHPKEVGEMDSLSYFKYDGKKVTRVIATPPIEQSEVEKLKARIEELESKVGP
jgi:hypothetical protein